MNCYSVGEWENSPTLKKKKLKKLGGIMFGTLKSILFICMVMIFVSYADTSHADVFNGLGYGSFEQDQGLNKPQYGSFEQDQGL